MNPHQSKGKIKKIWLIMLLYFGTIVLLAMYSVSLFGLAMSDFCPGGCYGPSIWSNNPWIRVIDYINKIFIALLLINLFISTYRINKNKSPLFKGTFWMYSWSLSLLVIITNIITVTIIII